MSLWVVLLAGGRGERLRREVNKVYLPIAGKEMLEYSLDTFRRSDIVDGLVVVVRPEDTEHVVELLAGKAPPVRIVEGGPTRHQSERLGLEALTGDVNRGEVEWIGIHDGARPFITLDLFRAVVEAAHHQGGAVPALASSGPLYQRQGDALELLDTRALRRAQTPQVFRARELLEGYRRADEAGFEGVDTAETVERFTDLRVGLVPGDPRNIKITFVEDVLEAEDLAAGFRAGRWVERDASW
jgi:2-C-methyl-D-erythritol 4-phosphate cytidylyltransferase